MPDWIIYGLFPVLGAGVLAFLAYGIASALKPVPRYDVVVKAERIAATPVKPYKPLHVREAEAIAARCWKNAERKARVQE